MVTRRRCSATLTERVNVIMYTAQEIIVKGGQVVVSRLKFVVKTDLARCSLPVRGRFSLHSRTVVFWKRDCIQAATYVRIVLNVTL